MKPEKLRIEGKTFDGLRSALNYYISLCLGQMRETGMKEGSVGAKINFQIDDTGSEETFNGKMARVDYLKIETSVDLNVPMKAKSKLDPLKGLKVTKDEKQMAYIISTENITFEDLLDEAEEQERREENGEAVDTAGH